MGISDKEEDAPLLYRTLHHLLPPFLTALWRPKAEGLEHVPEQGAAILASNHLSFLDSVFMPAVLDRPVFFLGKSDYFDSWTRHFFERVGVMPIDRSGGSKAEASLLKGQEILESGRLLGIYPEGTRSPDGRLHRGKTGPVRLALRTGAPIIPVAMIGTFEIQPPGQSLPRLRPVVVRFGEPVDLSHYGPDASEDRFALRAATDELMYELMLLSGQEYVDEYAERVKSGEVSFDDDDLDELGQLERDEGIDPLGGDDAAPRRKAG